ncbi:MAG: glycosyltransferase [Chloroflexi bacterium]|jgi:glycosyltransferase involved in cell wall biosynthesis|uniref:Glycosyl transferase family 1 n=1 Tax=Candidatus Thermofonsia Clade 3 bacterium TaxID=2364212 RepID=A0A2M8QGS7_9CHLR|nr:glycosyltransferase [Candidatus Roseilinea sp. NK_OTU-006]PJF49010.1 MAG: hypothetical protein CUN48_00675 [Candidatus Thermofonsia Clade 3 bacterium]RMG63408.1 MAG: glycosyltransferase [Chloroflexota bacterium]
MPVSRRIALLHYTAPPVVGGVESVIAHQARCLGALGHAVRIIAARGAQTDPQVCFVPFPLADSRHPQVLHVKAQLDCGQVTEAFERLRLTIKEALARVLADLDVVIAHNVGSLHKNLALTAALHDLFASDDALARPRLILWHHDLAWATPRYRAELHDGYPWNLLRTAWRNVRHVAISELRRKELASLTGIAAATVSVIPNGLDLARFHKLEARTRVLAERIRLTQADLILLLPVRVTPRKNIELALEVLAELRRSFRRPILIITGPLGPHNAKNADYFALLKQRRAALALEDNAYFLAEMYDHFLPDELITDLYRLADALFLPSREEGFGLPMLEAAISRLPIFCSDLAPLRDLGGDYAYYFSPDAAPGLLADAITERLRNDAAFQHASRTRRQFTWAHVCAEHIAPLIEAVCADE